MRLDAADIALLEIDIEALDPLGRGIAELLLAHIRTLEGEAEDMEKDHEHRLGEEAREREAADTANEESQERIRDILKKVDDIEKYLSNVRSEAARAIDELGLIRDP